MQSATGALAVFMTASNRDEALRIANALVEEQLAACVQVLPQMESVYRWQGKVERQNEILLIAKTTAESFGALEKRVREIHSYDTPEIVAVPIVAGSDPYLEWLAANSGGG